MQFISGDTERTASEQFWVKRASHGYIKRRWKSPKLNSQLSFENLVGIIRGFSGKCDNGNLDWIIVGISAPFGRQLSRETSGDPIEVERLPLVFCGNNEHVPLLHKWHLLKRTRIQEFTKVIVRSNFMFNSDYILCSDCRDVVFIGLNLFTFKLGYFLLNFQT